MADDIKALAFDVFGTVVDWRSSVAEAVSAALPSLDAGAFADAWRGRYQAAMEPVRSGARPWVKLDVLHREMLDEVIDQFGAPPMSMSEGDRARLNLVWHRLAPWPDVVKGLARLRRRFVLATLSNGNMSLLADLVHHGKLPFDCVLSVELAAAYKPQPQVYLKACELLDLAPAQVMMVAAHADDLEAARRVGMPTAFIARPNEWGDPDAFQPPPEGHFDVHAADFLDLAAKLKVR